MKIAVFGCSWTYGVPSNWSRKTTAEKYKHNIPQEDFVNWTRELGKIDPSLEIYNYAVPGTSIEFSLGMFERYLKNRYCDLTIFQATRPYRYTYWEENFNERLHFKKFENNVYQFDYSILDHITIVDHHNDTNKIWNYIGKTNKDHDYVKNYFLKTSDEMFENNYKSILSYINSKADICFSHEDHQLVESVQKSLGEEKFESYWTDIGKHFGVEGAQWQAKWILDKINTL